MENNSQIQITNLPPDFTENMLIDKFKAFGRILEYGFKKSHNLTGTRSGIITFQDPNDAKKAIEEMDQKTLDGFTISINYRSKHVHSSDHQRDHSHRHSHNHSHSSSRHESRHEAQRSSDVPDVEQEERRPRRERHRIQESSSSSDNESNEEADVELDSPPPTQRKKSFVPGKTISQNLIRIYHQILIQSGVPPHFQLDHQSIMLEKELDNQLWEEAKSAYSH